MQTQLDIVETQNEIIRKQSKIIDGLFARLSLEVAPGDIASLPELEAIKEVTKEGSGYGICG